MAGEKIIFYSTGTVLELETTYWKPANGRDPIETSLVGTVSESGDRVDFVATVRDRRGMRCETSNPVEMSFKYTQTVLLGMVPAQQEFHIHCHPVLHSEWKMAGENTTTAEGQVEFCSNERKFFPCTWKAVDRRVKSLTFSVEKEWFENWKKTIERIAEVSVGTIVFANKRERFVYENMELKNTMLHHKRNKLGISELHMALKGST